ncbi:hypothetical protein [Brunnivagina elsteri]|uniref:Fimbrial protein n=1 Tax=Brunnivagina elsteri CCALA 953 TaxID=987040 RepID=A0A2A2TE27_9CYAN|nr:hypothetical protein [Calothrix elsteri]PAX51885.1 hypothetical protein CK510_22375 [Calothrix elsteri CCALA 953]
MARSQPILLLLIITTHLVGLKSAIAEPTVGVPSDANQVCSFSEGTGGQLVTEGRVMPSKLGTLDTFGGSPIKMDVTCNKPAKLVVSAPIQVGGPEFKPVSTFTNVTTATGDSTKSNEAPLALPAGTTALSINLYVDKGSRLKVGNYQYTFKFTVAE